MNWLAVDGGLLALEVGVAQPGSAVHGNAVHRSAAHMKRRPSDRDRRLESLFNVETELFIALNRRSDCHGVGRGIPMNSDVVCGGSAGAVFEANGFHELPEPVGAAAFLG